MSNDDTTDRTDGRTNTRRGLLRAGAGGLAATLALPVLSGTAAAHFPDELDVVVVPSEEALAHQKPGHEHLLDAGEELAAV